MDKNGQLESGWATQGEPPYHFEHIPYSQAADELSSAENLYVVETINTTLVKGKDPMEVHKNLYFDWGLPAAIALAARITISSIDVAENVVAIRPAKDDEHDRFVKVYDWFSKRYPKDISDEFAAS